MKYFISYALKHKLAPITQYGNTIVDLPQEIIDEKYVEDLQKHINEHYTEYDVCILNIQRLPL